MRLKDIANELGVSISTVSRALNHPELNAAGPELTKRILAIAARGNYSPDPVALRLQKPEMFSQPDNLYVLIARPQAEVKDDPFYSTISTAIAQEAARCRRHIRCTYSSPDGGLQEMLQDFAPEAPGDVIVLGRFRAELLPKLRECFRYIVYVGLNRLSVDCDQVICDGCEAVQDAVSYLYQLGHRRMGFIGAETEDRFKGFVRGINKVNLPLTKDAIVQTNILSMDGGYRGMLRLLQQAPSTTGVVCANDMVAIGALQACKDQGRAVPDDISIIGLDDVPSIRFVEPKLTSIRVPMEEMGRIAVRALQERMLGIRALPLRFMAPYEIVGRSSCQAIE